MTTDGRSDLGAIEKHDALRQRIASLGALLVAYSGGVDSTLLAVTARAVLGERALPVLAVSDTCPESEVEAARGVGVALGLGVLEVETYELTDPTFRANTAERCYHCKRELFGLLRAVADTRGLHWVADGSNVDDLGDHRPGMRAAREYGVVSPLLDVGMSKNDVRALARELDLPNWDKPSMACLASRFPYGEQITEEGLHRVARAEDALRALGLRGFRVRSHGDVARLEVDPSEMELAWGLREHIAKELRAAGYAFAAQDLEGYRTGSLNATLSSAERIESMDGANEA